MPKINSIWEWQIDNKTSVWSHSIKELWGYRHLLSGLVRRYFLLNYQQTILGPCWVLFQPIMTLITYVLVFNKLIGIPTGNLPPVIFYASGIILWNFFSDSSIGTSSTIRGNLELFNKVYFPRIIMPLSVISTHFLRFMIQLVVFLIFVIYYWVFTDFELNISLWILVLPVAIVFIGLLGLGMGLIFSVLTAKYRDLSNLVTLGLRTMMFATPVIYPMVAVPESKRWIVQLNPLTPLFELFRLSLLGEGYVNFPQLLYSLVVTVLILTGAILLFNKQSVKLIDVA